MRPHEGVWVSRGLAEVVSGPVDFTDAAAAPVGDAGWYLERPGFAWGGIGVAACWYGGAVGVARRLLRRCAGARPGPARSSRTSAPSTRRCTRRAPRSRRPRHAVDGDAVPSADLLASRTRAVVAGAAEEVILRAGHALGPAPLALEEEHARRVADLGIYLRQHHAERDAARLGSLLLVDGASEGGSPW